MQKFKVGDSVEVTDESGSAKYQGKLGHVGIVTAILRDEFSSNGQMLYTDLAPDSGMYGHRFKLVDPNMTKRKELVDALDVLRKYEVRRSRTVSNKETLVVGKFASGDLTQDELLDKLFPLETPAQKKLKELEEKQLLIADEMKELRESMV